MKTRLLTCLLFSALAVAALSQGFPDVITPKQGDTDKDSLHKINKILNDARTGSAPLVIAGEGQASRSGSIATSQVTLSTAAQVVIAASTARRSVIVRNTDASISIYVGAAGVTTTTGMIVKAGEAVTINTTAAIYAIAVSGTPVANTLSEND